MAGQAPRKRTIQNPAGQKKKKKSTAAEAAERYATDADFAEEFSQALHAIYEEQLRRLERIAALSGMRAGNLPVARTAFQHAAPQPQSVDPEQVSRVLRQFAPRKSGSRDSAEPQEMTRGQVARALGIDSRDAGLTRALRTLRDAGKLSQRGERRSARYGLKAD